jgi:hypothetical protein
LLGQGCFKNWDKDIACFAAAIRQLKLIEAAL